MIKDNECICPRTDCPRHGNCDECRAHHVADKKHPAYCEREKLKAQKKEERARRRAQR